MNSPPPPVTAQLLRRLEPRPAQLRCVPSPRVYVCVARPLQASPLVVRYRVRVRRGRIVSIHRLA